jgi:DNA-binding beta-propeller fold protein YncE
MKQLVIRVGVKPVDITINEVTNKIYVANSGSDTVSVIDGINNNKI